MLELIKAKEPFRFYTRLHLSELTGLRAFNLKELVDIIETTSGSCIYHHTHRFLQQHIYLNPEPPNDFAYWVTGVLGEEELGESLASIDTIEFSSIRQLREKIVATIQEYLKNNSQAESRFARSGDEFHFIKAISFVIPTNYAAYDLREFLDVLSKITIDSIYFHIFEAKLRLERKTNDFSYWIENSIGDKKLADEIAKLDPYTCTIEDLRKRLIRLIEKRIKK